AGGPDAGASPCPAEMALVAGRYCPVVSQPCARQNPVAGHHCLAYGPSSCAVKERVALRFCMDRYEWPNRKGELPLTLVSWPEARALCGALGKRLCTEREFNFACEGEAMRPFVYGFERSDAICNSDRPYRPRTFAFKAHDACMAEPACRAAFEGIDQRVPAGSRPGCVSGDGVHDLNGNANEWVMREDERAPRRSGLKGGWWGPVRNRCRPMTTAHLEGDFGYEAGFRCCRDAD
ncbi:MAG: SUMF1/EgtB/PvdO family nonheme iron enzyme, partial [Polyangiaceae bacterium]|nr:SUMF1/EgtB/PvdO family nonheme iron enzyme [Polyangiaceae bacterium]